MVLGAKQSPIDVIETIPEALTAVADSFRSARNYHRSAGAEVTVTTDRAGAVVRRPV